MYLPIRGSNPYKPIIGASAAHAFGPCMATDNMDGVCDSPSGYRFPSGADVEAKWRGTKAELAELAAPPALAGFEWRDEAQKMLASWEAAEAKRVCAIL